jgi:hypothetical protein
MEPKISNPGTTGAQQNAEGQSLSSQTNTNQATQRSNTIPGTNRVSNQEGASFSGPGNQATQGGQSSQQQRQTDYPGSNSA